MGSGISSNYEDITPIFTLGYWKVHSATRKETHDPVSLWLLDIDKIKSDSSGKKERNTYIESCLYSMKTMQQLDHPNILKIYEANENLSDLAFSAEPISFSMEKDLKYSNDEAYYIADQLATLASYLSNDKKFVSFHYYPGSFAFTSKFILKLCLFNYTSLIVGNQNQTVPRYPWRNIPFAPPLNYTAPEYSNNLQTTSAADTFSYGAIITSIFIGKQFFNYQNEKDIQRAIATGSFDIPDSIPSDIRGLLQCCFESDPSMRLTFHEIVRFPVFMCLLIRNLREIDSIKKRSPSERFEFYIRLKQNIGLFSLRLIRNKILPLLLDDVRFDVRFGSAIFPLIYYISDKMSNNEFMETIFRPLGDLMRRMEPPEFGVAVLDGVPIIINHVERNLIFDIVYPMLMAGFHSPNSSVQVAAAKNMPFLASMVTENCITYNIIPNVSEVILHASDSKVIGFLLKTYEIGLDKMDNDMFIEGVIPTLFKLWKKVRSPHLAKPYLVIIQKQNASLMKNIGFIVPLICEILKNEEVDLQIQSALCTYIEKQFNELKKERRIPNDQNIQESNNQPKLNSNLAPQTNGSYSGLPSFARPIQQQQAPESLPNIPVIISMQENNGQQASASFFDTSSSTLSSRERAYSNPQFQSSPNNHSIENDFMAQSDQADSFNTFDVNVSNSSNGNATPTNNTTDNINLNNTQNTNISSNPSNNNINLNKNLNASNDNFNNNRNLNENTNNFNNQNVSNEVNQSNNNNLANSFNVFSDSNSSNNNLSNSIFNSNTINTINESSSFGTNNTTFNSFNNDNSNNNSNNAFPTYQQNIFSSNDNFNNSSNVLPIYQQNSIPNSENNINLHTNSNEEAIKQSVNEFSFF